MRKDLRSRAVSRRLTPSPSMVVAILALIVALSGTAYAAATINGKNIKKGTITAKQVKDKSLTGKDLKDKSVLGADLKDGTVANADLADGSVSEGKLGSDAVTGAKVKDGSLGAGDLAAGTIVPPPIGTATSTTAYAVPGLAFSDIPGMGITYTAPPGTTKLIITFSAECAVNYTATSQYLSTNITVNGADAEPAGGGNYQFCTVSETSGYSQTSGSSMTRVVSAGPGTHTIQVQAAEVLLANGTLDDMALTVVPSS